MDKCHHRIPKVCHVHCTISVFKKKKKYSNQITKNSIFKIICVWVLENHKRLTENSSSFGVEPDFSAHKQLANSIYTLYRL